MSYPPSPRRTGLGPRLARRFYASIFVVVLLATYALFIRRVVSHRPPPLLQVRKEDLECRLVHQADDQCAFVLANCEDDEAGLLSYLKLYYCTLGRAQPVAFAVLAAWLGLLFTTIGIAASDFFSINLSTIASILGLSESLAGVTFLAFGNGSPDVFSTFAAMGSNSGSMAVGELIGAAGFITAVVAGSMALVREFKVAKRTFVRDICFFIFAVSFSMVFLADGHLHLWECVVMVGFYLFYVVVVVGWHWYSSQRRKRRQKEAASRGHFYSASSQPADELEPYRDDDDDDGEDAAPMGGPGSRSPANAIPDISALERGSRVDIEVDGQNEDENLDRHMQVAAEMTSSMRVNRPRGSRSNTTLGQIRPSFVGALEFRSVLASLQNSSNVRMTPMHTRRQSEAMVNRHEAYPATPLSQVDNPLQIRSAIDPGASVGRDRARSHGNLPVGWSFPSSSTAPEIVTQGPTSSADGSTPTPAFPPPSRSSTSKDGNLAPPAPDAHVRPQSSYFDGAESIRSVPQGSPRSLRLQIPSPQIHASGHTSPSLSPFPGLSESPRVLTPIAQSPVLSAQNGSHIDQAFFVADLQEELPKPVRWWPYSILPPPHILLNTLFPTLQGWRTKTIWDKFVSLISVPSIFLLVVTLPVVETEATNDDDDSVDLPAVGEPGRLAPVVSVSVETGSQTEPETEWQRYRRNTRSRSASRVSGQTTPAVTVGLGSPLLGPSLGPSVSAPSEDNRAEDSLSRQQSKAVQPPSLVLPDGGMDTSEEPPSWNRWLVVIQIFTGPLFTAFIVWANIMDDLEKPGMTLFRMVLYSLLGSLIMLALLLATTSPDVRPRYHFLLCFLGFIISVAWISTVAGEVVGVLKAFGVILGISEAILGLTIFAVGNSLGDLVADITVARLGYPVMALSACFGGPMLNILLGIGIGGAWMTTKTANEKHHNHPDKPLKYKPYRIEVGGTLMISAITVLLTLVFLLAAVPYNNWMMSRKIGWCLIGIWSVSTVINLLVELTGAWKDVA